MSYYAFVQFRIVMIVYDLLLVTILHSDDLFVLELAAYSQCSISVWPTFCCVSMHVNLTLVSQSSKHFFECHIL